MKSIAAFLFLLSLWFSVPSLARASDYSGSYSDGSLTVQITANSAGYTGQICKGAAVYPLIAAVDGDHLSGTFTVDQTQFAFTAMLSDGGLVLTSANKTYQLARQPAGAAPAPAAAVGDPLVNYVVINKVDAGRALLRELPNVHTAEGALRAVFPDLAIFFGERPTVLGGYEDQIDHKIAFVSFTATLNGQPMKGFVSAKLRDNGAVAFVVFGPANATREQWAQLTEPPSSGDEEFDLKQAMARVPLVPYVFPDGTGAVGLANGWTTNAQTESNLTITGPADQRIRMALGGTLYTPESMMAGQARNNPNMLIAPYNADPSVALQSFVRANGIASQRRGGPSFSVDKVLKVVPVPSRNPGAVGAQILYDMTVVSQNGPKAYRVLIQFEVSPLNRNLGTWGYYTFLQLISPRESFKHDQPIMLAQAFSLSENAAAIMAKSRTEIDAANKLAAAKLAANAKIAQAHYDQTRSVEDNELIKQRSNADFDEVIRGERAIEDTQSGTETSVNLADVHKITDALNYNDPGRYVEVPLRDRLYPMPGHEHDPDYVGR